MANGALAAARLLPSTPDIPPSEGEPSLLRSARRCFGERTRAGMARARAQGKRIGRPALGLALQRKIARQLKAWLSPYAVAKQLGIGAHTVAKYSPFDASAAGA
jgi:hypothetical protein